MIKDNTKDDESVDGLHNWSSSKDSVQREPARPVTYYSLPELSRVLPPLLKAKVPMIEWLIASYVDFELYDQIPAQCHLFAVGVDHAALFLSSIQRLPDSDPRVERYSPLRQFDNGWRRCVYSYDPSIFPSHFPHLPNIYFYPVGKQSDGELRVGDVVSFDMNWVYKDDEDDNDDDNGNDDEYYDPYAWRAKKFKDKERGKLAYELRQVLDGENGEDLFVVGPDCTLTNGGEELPIHIGVHFQNAISKYERLMTGFKGNAAVTALCCDPRDDWLKTSAFFPPVPREGGRTSSSSSSSSPSSPSSAAARLPACGDISLSAPPTGDPAFPPSWALCFRSSILYVSSQNPTHPRRWYGLPLPKTVEEIMRFFGSIDKDPPLCVRVTVYGHFQDTSKERRYELMESLDIIHPSVMSVRGEAYLWSNPASDHPHYCLPKSMERWFRNTINKHYQDKIRDPVKERIECLFQVQENVAFASASAPRF